MNNAKELRGGQNSNCLNCRDERIDSVKYWLIILVIAGHVFGYYKNSENQLCLAIWNWIYIFHMPLFIFISGYFTRKKDSKYLFASIWKLLEPLLIFHTIAQISTYIAKGTISINDILTPWYVLWYLFSLICWRLILQILPDKVLNNAKILVVIALLISVLSGFLPFNRVLSLQRMFSFMPYFFLGYSMQNKNFFLPAKYRPLCLIFMVLVFFALFTFHSCLGNLKHDVPYKSYVDAIKRIFAIVLSIPMSWAFINLCISTSWVARQGRLTMQYFIYHALILPPIMAILDRLNITYSLLIATVITITITIGLVGASYLPFFRLFTNPSLFFKKNNTLRRKQDSCIL